ncbi:MAG: amidohydrolase family protein [Acidobacteriota bacterium]
MTRIDSHVHFWKYHPAAYPWIDDTMAPLRRDFLPADVAPELRAAGFDACVAVQTAHTIDETRWLLELADHDPLIAGVVGWVDLQSTDADAQLETVARHPKLIGIRHIVQAEPGGFLARADFRRGLGRLERLGLPYDVLVYARQLPEAVDFVAAFPGQRFVLDHLGKPDIRAGAFDEWRRHLDRLARFPHVFAKLSGLVTEADWHGWTAAQLHRYIHAAIDAFGAERLMIGSDWPVCTLAGRYGAVMEVVTTALDGRTSVERDAVLGGTARAFWNLGVSG